MRVVFVCIKFPSCEREVKLLLALAEVCCVELVENQTVPCRAAPRRSRLVLIRGNTKQRRAAGSSSSAPAAWKSGGCVLNAELNFVKVEIKLKLAFHINLQQEHLTYFAPTYRSQLYSLSGSCGVRLVDPITHPTRRDARVRNNRAGSCLGV